MKGLGGVRVVAEGTAGAQCGRRELNTIRAAVGGGLAGDFISVFGSAECDNGWWIRRLRSIG